jgi:hypothetical protein
MTSEREADYLGEHCCDYFLPVEYYFRIFCLPIQFSYYFNSIFILFPHLRPGLQIGLFLSDFPIKIVYVFFISSIHAAHSAHLIIRDCVRFQVLTAASMKMAVFWVVAPCSLAEVYRRFRGACFLRLQGDESLRRHPEDSHLHPWFHHPNLVNTNYCYDNHHRRH